MGSIMREPLYKVGEEIILVSKNWPAYNGEYVVEVVHKDGDITPKTPPTIIDTDGGYSYYLGFNVPDNSYTHWCEQSLRKKHKPSDDSFEDMMNKLKIGETV